MQKKTRSLKRLALKSAHGQFYGSQAAVDQYLKVFTEMNQSI